MNKKVLFILLILFALGFGFCFYAQWEWALQMLLAGATMTIIIAIKSREGHDGSVQTNLAELITILGITMSPNIMEKSVPSLNNLRNWINSQVELDWITIKVYENISYILVVALMYLFAHLASKLFQDNTIMKKHQGKKSIELNNPDFMRKREYFCNMLATDLVSIDRETQWNDYYFTPLEAEVIIEDSRKIKKKSSDLMKALRKKSNENAFILLGDPGSGKSTVLRTLAKILLLEVKKTGKIPIYINLKEWDTDDIFTESSPPSLHHLLDFVKQNLKDRLGDIFVPEFLTDYFNTLYELGHFYFIFDSFDEIPMLLDEPESSWLVDKISSLLFNVCAHNKNSKIILSSRFFRQPTDKFQATIKMQIKPFSENSLQKCFKNFTDSNMLCQQLFSGHKDLIGIARNPFYASLISLYYKNTQQLPSREVELYNNFIHSRLSQCEKAYSMLTRNNVSHDDVILYAQKIAVAIFDVKHGIEIPLQTLIDEIKVPQQIIDIMQKSKLIRIGGGIKRAISFSHRRFNEYFVVCSLMEKGINPYIESIPTDSKWRDTLVLYAQICEKSKVNILVKFCCSFFDKVNTIESHAKGKKRKIYHKIVIDDNFRKALHSLRFLIAAFSSQSQSVAKSQGKILEFVNLLLNDGNILYQKIALQAVPILNKESICNIIDDILRIDNSWINDEAFNNCSYLDVLPIRLYIKIVRYFTFMAPDKFIKQYGQHMFYLSLSKNYRKIRTICIVRLIYYCVAIIFMPPLILLSLHSDMSLLIYRFLIMLFLFRGIFWLISKFSLIYGHEWDIEGRLFLNPFIIMFFSLSSFIINPYSAMVCILLPSNISLYYYFLFLRINYKQVLKEISLSCKIIVLAIGFFAFNAGLMVLLNWINVYLPVLTILSYIFYCFASIVFLHHAVKYLNNLRKDNIKFHNTIIFNAFDRAILSDLLDEFSTNYYQKKFLMVLMEKNINVYGEWKNSEFPKLRNYDLDALLAKMEEKWSGLL